MDIRVQVKDQRMINVPFCKRGHFEYFINIGRSGRPSGIERFQRIANEYIGYTKVCPVEFDVNVLI